MGWRCWEVFEASGDGVAVTDEGGLIIFANPRLTQLSGYPPAELLGRPVEMLVPDAARSRHEERHRLYRAEPYPRMMGHGPALQLRRRDGSLLDVEIALAPMGTAAGARTVATVRDISDRLAADERLRASEAAFRTAFEGAPIGVAVIAVSERGDASVVLANRGLAAMLGCSVAELIGGDLSLFSEPKDHANDTALLAEVGCAKADGYARLKRYRRADGSHLWAEVRGTRFSLPDVPGRLLLAHWVDVTDRVTQQRLQALEGDITGCVAAVATAALAGDAEPNVLGRIVAGACAVVGADGCGLALRDPSGEYRWEASHGEPPIAAVPAAALLAERPLLGRLRQGETVTMTRLSVAVPRSIASAFGPVAVAPFGVLDGAVGGFLVTARHPGAEPYAPAEAEGLSRLAAQTQLAVHLARAQADRQRLALLVDRQRIARELHDRILQDIIAVGMRLSADADREPDEHRRVRELERIGELEQIVRQLRGVVFETRVGDRREPVAAIHALVAEAERVLGHHPVVTVRGAVDDLAPDLVDDILAVLREGLANVARHAHAAHTWVTVEVRPEQVRLIVDDDGVGLQPQPRNGYGVANIADRAAAREGTTALVSGPRGGARLTWECPSEWNDLAS